MKWPIPDIAPKRPGSALIENPESTFPDADSGIPGNQEVASAATFVVLDAYFLKK